MDLENARRLDAWWHLGDLATRVFRWWRCNLRTLLGVILSRNRSGQYWRGTAPSVGSAAREVSRRRVLVWTASGKTCGDREMIPFPRADGTVLFIQVMGEAS